MLLGGSVSQRQTMSDSSVVLIGNTDGSNLACLFGFLKSLVSGQPLFRTRQGVVNEEEVDVIWAKIR